MSKMDDEWSVETPPRRYTPKRQKTDPEVKIKLTYPQQEGREDHILHVLFLQTIMSVNNVDMRVLNKRGEALKEAAVADLTTEAFHKNHFNTKVKVTGNFENKKGKVVVIHRIRGIHTDSILKQEKKVLDFLKQHSMHLSQHDWQEDEWDTRVIGFFTTVFPKAMNKEYATKIVTRDLHKNKHNTKIPTFRLQNLPMRGPGMYTRAYGLEVKAEDVRAMMTAIKSNISPGNFVPFHLRSVDETAFNKAVSFINKKNENTWSFVINFVSEGSFFKLEDKIKEAVHTNHVIYDPLQKTMKILTTKKLFDASRDIIRKELKNWCQSLDPEDIRQFDTEPELAHLVRDDFSSSSNSYTSHSISSIMSFEIEEIEVRNTNTTNTAATPPTTETTPSDLSDPVVLPNTTTEISQLKDEVSHYKRELTECTLRLEKFQTMLETIMEKVDHMKSSQHTTNRRPE